MIYDLIKLTETKKRGSPIFGKPRLSISFVIHIHSYAHRVIRQDDDDGDMQRYSSYFFVLMRQK